MIAAIAIQKSNRCHPGEAAHLGQVHHPHDHCLDDQSSEHGLGQIREERREHQKGEQDHHAGGQRRQAGARAGVVVQRAGGQARRDRHSLEQASADIRHALGGRFLVDVDAIAVPGCERPGVAGGLREPDEDQRHRRQANRARVIPQQRDAGDLQRRQPSGYVADQGHAVSAQIEQPGGHQAADNQDEGTRDARRDRPQPEHHRERDAADEHRQRLDIAERPQPGPQLLKRVRAGDLCAGELRQLTDHDIDRRAEQEPGDHRPGEELRDPPHLEHREEKEQHAGNERNHRDQGRRILDSLDSGHRNGARGHGSQSRARPGRDLPARPEDRIQDRAGRRGVQAVLQRDPRDPGVAEVLRNDQGSYGNPGDQITSEPATLVGTYPPGHRDEAQSVPRRS